MFNFDLYKLTNPKCPEDIKAILEEAISELNIINQHLSDILNESNSI